MDIESKPCTKCGQMKPLAQFSKSGLTAAGRPRLQSACKTCCGAAAITDYHANKERYYEKARKRERDLDALINSYKARPCVDCGESYPPYVMDFDHRDPNEKVDKVSTMRRRRMAFATIITEIEKCDVVCANCHRERTNIQTPARYAKAA